MSLAGIDWSSNDSKVCLTCMVLADGVTLITLPINSKLLSAVPNSSLASANWKTPSISDTKRAFDHPALFTMKLSL